MGRNDRVLWAVLWIFSVWGAPSHAGAAVSCESVCDAKSGVSGKSIQQQWDQLFKGQRVCRVTSGSDSPSRSIQEHRDLFTGARMEAAVLTGGCQMNRPVLNSFRESVYSEGSQGFVRRSLERAGLQNKPGCFQEISAGSPMKGGDLLRLGHQAMIVASVGEDPFGIDARLAADSTPLRFSGKNPVSGAQQLCREWLMDSSKFQISVVFLSQEGRHGSRVRQGTFGSLISEDHPGSLWDHALQEWALPDCVQKVMGRGYQAASTPSSPLKVERHTGAGPGCRVPVSGLPSSRESECALCCAAGGRAP